MVDRLSKDWRSQIYAFYEPVPEITYVKGWRCHEFKCAACSCKYRARCYLDTKDKSSTGNLIKHTKNCWGDDTWNAANRCLGIDEARNMIVKPMGRMESISTIFKRLGKGRVTYSNWMHTKTEIKYLGRMVSTYAS